MIVRIVSLILIIFVQSNSILAQNLKDFTGIYAVKQRCWEGVRNSFEQITEYEVEVNYSTNDSTDLEVSMVMYEPFTLGFNVKNDSLFWIYSHIFLNEDGTMIDVGGSGVIYEDSIDLNMDSFYKNTYLFIECDCNGNKIRDAEVGVNESNLFSNSVKLYPNPVKNELQVLWPILSGKIYNYYRIFNTNGQSVLESKSQFFERIDVSSLPNGTYIIAFLNDESTLVSKRFLKIE